MAAVTLKVEGGAQMNRTLALMARGLKEPVELRAGFLENAHYPDTDDNAGLSVAQVAFWNEFGTLRAPARPFMRNTIAKQSKHWADVLARTLPATGYDAKKTLNVTGLVIKEDFTTAIFEWPADNAPSTVARKGFNKGLIDTKVMAESVDYEIRKK